MKQLSSDVIIKLLSREESGFVRGRLGGDFTISAVSTDSRSIAPGSLFIPIAGERVDGHDYINAAFESGAAAALSHREYRGERPVILVEDTREALKRLAEAYRGLFSPVVAAVTGSVGKTMTKETVAAVLSAKYITHKTKGNFNSKIGLPLTLLSLDETHGAAVFEMGMSDRGEISALSKLARPDIGIITNIGTSHIEFLGSRENIRSAKLEILDGMGPEGTLVLNGDDELLKSCPEAAGRKVLYFGIENKAADIRALDITRTECGSVFTIIYPGGQVRAETVIAGRHSVYNALAAFAAGLCAGVPAQAAAAAIMTVRPEGMRQNIRRIGPVTVIEDCYNANPDSMKAALAVLAEFGGRKIALLGDMLELGALSVSAHRELGARAAAAADIIIALGAFSGELAAGARAAGAQAVYTPARADVPELIKTLARKGDVLLVKGSRGMRLEEIIEKYKEII